MVDPFIPLSCHLAVRLPLRISCVLRPRRLSPVLFHAAAPWLLCFRGSTVRRCADVDLRYAGLPGARGDSQYEPAFSTECPPWRLAAIGIAPHCRRAAGSATCGGGLDGNRAHSWCPRSGCCAAPRRRECRCAVRLLGT